MLKKLILPMLVVISSVLLFSCISNVKTDEAAILVNNVYFPTQILPYPSKWVRGVCEEAISGPVLKFYIPMLQEVKKYSLSGATISLLTDKEEYSLRALDGAKISLNVSIKYRFEKTKLAALTKLYSGKTDDFIKIYLKAEIANIVWETPAYKLRDANSLPIVMGKVRDRLNMSFEKYGIVALNVKFENIIFDNYYRSQMASRDKIMSDIDSKKVEENYKVRELELKKEILQKEIDRKLEEARGYYNTKVKEADVLFDKYEKDARVIEAKAPSYIEGIKVLSKTLAGSSGKNIVNLELANILKSKKIICGKSKEAVKN